MRPSRETFEALMVEYGHTFGPGFGPELMRPNARAAVLSAFDEQEATIRELSEALEAVLDNVPACVFVDTYPWEGRCGIHDFTIQKPRECAVQHAVEVLARTRGGK